MGKDQEEENNLENFFFWDWYRWVYSNEDVMGHLEDIKFDSESEDTFSNTGESSNATEDPSIMNPDILSYILVPKMKDE